MRIIAGASRGIKLNTLEGQEITRPTIERVKEGLFSSIQFILEGSNVLDLFAGSGQIGIEALSRGASHCTFVDDNINAIEIIKTNLQLANLQDRATVIQTDAFSFIDKSAEKFNIVFLDPPYKSNVLQDILPQISKICKSEAIIIAESEKNAKLDSNYNDLLMKKHYKYGSVSVTKYIKFE